MQLLRRSRVFSAYIHHEVGVCGEERHLTLCIATVGAMRVGLDQLPDREAIRCFTGRDGDVLALGPVSFSIGSGRPAQSLEDARGSRNTSIREVPNSRPIGVSPGPCAERLTNGENTTVAQARAAFTRSGVMGSSRSRRPVA